MKLTPEEEENEEPGVHLVQEEIYLLNLRLRRM